MPAKLRLHAASATFFSLAMILAIAVVGLVALTGAEAADQPKCGDTITADTTLHKDLVNCPNNGIVIGADDDHPRSERPHRSTATGPRLPAAIPTPRSATAGSSMTAMTESP